VRNDEEEKGMIYLLIEFLSISSLVQVSFNQDVITEKKKVLP
jgi:hypothetical protein